MAVRAIGPVLGNSLSSACTRMYVDWSIEPSKPKKKEKKLKNGIETVNDVWRADFESNDLRWIGAWWLGFVVIAALLLSYAVVMAAFPRRLISTVEKTTEVEAVDSIISASIPSLTVKKVEEDVRASSTSATTTKHELTSTWIFDYKTFEIIDLVLFWVHFGSIFD